MLLVTTNHPDVWKEPGPFLFLGEWAKPFEKRAIWSRPENKTLPYHWDDRRQVYQDFQYLEGLYERVLAQLATELNRLHHTSHSLRYWRIVTGPWLRNFLSVFYDRFLSVQAAAESGVTLAWASSTPLAENTPIDYTHFFLGALEDSYNHELYSWLIRENGNFTVRENEFPMAAPTNPPLVEKNKSLARMVAGTALSLVPDKLRGHDLLFPLGTYLTAPDLAKLKRACGMAALPEIASGAYSVTAKPSSSLRRQWNLSLNGSEFEKRLAKILPLQIPVAYLEGYGELLRYADKHYPAKTKVTLTAVAQHHDEPFKTWLAKQADAGGKIVVSQHGGNYGTTLWCEAETHERKISDAYLSWGWTSPADDKVISVASPKLFNASVSIKGDPQGPLLLALNSFPRYAYRMFSAPIAGQMHQYLGDQIRFCKELTPGARAQLIIRPYPMDMGWGEKERILEELPGILLSTQGHNFYEQLNRSRLHLCSHNTTTYLETFAANLPTVLFWNPAHWELRPEARPFFEELQEAGILFHKPEAAARHVSEIYKDARGWWDSPRVQTARRHFCAQYARADANWPQQWASVLKQWFRIPARQVSVAGQTEPQL